METMYNNLRGISTIIRWVGLCAIIIGIVLGCFKWTWIINSSLVSATVVGYEESSGNNGIAYAVRYTYPDGHGGTITKTSFLKRDLKPYEISQNIPVYLNRNDVNDSAIDSFLELWFPTAILIFIGLGNIVMSIVISFINSKRQNTYITAQQVDSAEASTIAVPPSEPSGSPR